MRRFESASISVCCLCRFVRSNGWLKSLIVDVAVSFRALKQASTCDLSIYLPHRCPHGPRPQDHKANERELVRMIWLGDDLGRKSKVSRGDQSIASYRINIRVDRGDEMMKNHTIKGRFWVLRRNHLIFTEGQLSLSQRLTIYLDV